MLKKMIVVNLVGENINMKDRTKVAIVRYGMMVCCIAIIQLSYLFLLTSGDNALVLLGILICTPSGAMGLTMLVNTQWHLNKYYPKINSRMKKD